VRHRAIRRQLEHHYGEALAGTRGVTELPVAGVRQQDNDEFVHFSGADTILGPLIDAPESVAGHFELRPEHRVSELTHDHGRVTEAHVTDLRSGRGYRVRARTYIVACGLLTAQLLWKSGIRPSALGRHLMEHPIAFAQVVLSRDLVEEIRSERVPPRVAQWGSESRTIRSEPDDPVPVPMSDPPPMLCIPVSERRRWHCQIHRDSFSYGAVPDDIDDRLIVDLRWFGMVDPQPDNRVTFDDRRNDVLGMPKARFDYQLHDDDRTRAHAMMGDLLFAAQGLGGFLPTAQPQFMPAGTSLHFTGVYRMGAVDDGSSVVDSYSRVWGFDNLVLGGNGVIPDANASNPTLTSIALATRAARKILES
jgi:pyranose oxidase